MDTDIWPARRFSRKTVPLLAAISGIALLLPSRTLAAGNVSPDSTEASESAEHSADKTAKADQQQKIVSLIAQLGDKDYFVRQKAQDELAELGFEAYELLTAASTNEDLEISTRAKYLLKLMRVEWTAADDPPEVKRILKGYETLDHENRDEKIHLLATLPDGKGITALCRLARYEKSNVLSKRAALALMQSTPNGDPPTAQQANQITKNIERGSRPAVKWLDVWLRMARDPEAAMDDFRRLADAEIVLLQRSPNETNVELVTAFLRYYVGQLKRLNKNDAALQAMHQIIDLQKEDSTTLAELAEWLLAQKAWEPLDYMEKRFTAQFESDAILTYTVAEAKLAQNDAAKAEELAAKALKLNPGSEYLAQHSVVAQYLKKRGCTAWTIKEYEYMIAHSGDQDYFALRSVMVLAEIYYDQGKNLEAGKTIEKFLKKPSVRRLRALGPSAEIPLDNALADMNYYFGCHWESQGDRKQQREFMEKALEADPTEINALIGYYHLPDLTPEEKQKVVGLIKRSADDARESIRLIRKQPVDLHESASMVSKESSDCNQYAWLIANTEGDLDEALQYARRAVELEPQSGGIYDTLAHVYFAKGDYENAVKIERKAHELEPHSAMIQRKLELFEKTWESKK